EEEKVVAIQVSESSHPKGAGRQYGSEKQRGCLRHRDPPDLPLWTEHRRQHSVLARIDQGFQSDAALLLEMHELKNNELVVAGRVGACFTANHASLATHLSQRAGDYEVDRGALSQRGRQQS